MSRPKRSIRSGREQPSRNLWKSAEYLVASILEEKGFQVNLVSHDDGIDMTASRKGNTYGIQVKSSTLISFGSYGQYPFQISVNAFDRYYGTTTFFVLVLYGEHRRIVILPHQKIRKHIARGDIKTGKDGKFYVFRITESADGLYLRNKQNQLDGYISGHVDSWNLIK